MVDVPRGVAERLDVATASEVADSPDRLARHRQHHSAAADPSNLTESTFGRRDVFEYFEPDDQVDAVVGERETGGVTEEHWRVERMPIGGKFGVGKVETDDHCLGKALNEPLCDPTLTCSELNDDRRRETVEDLVQCGEEARHHSFLDRIG